MHFQVTDNGKLRYDDIDFCDAERPFPPFVYAATTCIKRIGSPFLPLVDSVSQSPPAQMIKLVTSQRKSTLYALLESYLWGRRRYGSGAPWGMLSFPRKIELPHVDGGFPWRSAVLELPASRPRASNIHGTASSPCGWKRFRHAGRVCCAAVSPIRSVS